MRYEHVDNVSLYTYIHIYIHRYSEFAMCYSCIRSSLRLAPNNISDGLAYVKIKCDTGSFVRKLFNTRNYLSKCFGHDLRFTEYTCGVLVGEREGDAVTVIP